jgi:hypothetical protein
MPNPVIPPEMARIRPAAVDGQSSSRSTRCVFPPSHCLYPLPVSTLEAVWRTDDQQSQSALKHIPGDIPRLTVETASTLRPRHLSTNIPSLDRSLLSIEHTCTRYTSLRCPADIQRRRSATSSQAQRRQWAVSPACMVPLLGERNSGIRRLEAGSGRTSKPEHPTMGATGRMLGITGLCLLPGYVRSHHTDGLDADKIVHLLCECLPWDCLLARSHRELAVLERGLQPELTG